jgi:hypothetical protein
VVAAIGLLLAFPTALTAADGPNGRYCGALQFRTEMVETETTFFPAAGKPISGTYLFRDITVMEPGTLRESAVGTGLDRTFIWHDKYGEGRLALTFSPDYESFTGKWGSMSEVRFPWHGSRCRDSQISNAGSAASSDRAGS